MTLFRGLLGHVQGRDELSSKFSLVSGSEAKVHMPQADLLHGILHLMIQAITSWKATDRVPTDDLPGLASFHLNGCSGVCLTVLPTN